MSGEESPDTISIGEHVTRTPEGKRAALMEEEDVQPRHPSAELLGEKEISGAGGANGEDPWRGPDKSTEADDHCCSCDHDEPPPLQINHDALKHIASSFLPGNHGNCTEIITRRAGAYHEIRDLQFEDGWSCIGRLTRNRKESLSVLESEAATAKYVRRHTSIPVPEIYFINTNPNHVVGAAFVLMEKLPGQHLYDFWKRWSLTDKFHAIKQIADVLAQLCNLRFDMVGSLNANGEMGPLQNLTYSYDENGRGPFNNTIEYLTSFLHPLEPKTETVMEYYKEVESLIVDFLHQNDNNPILQAPYPLIHSDFDGQNMLFEQPDPDQPPQLTGIIDWDQSHSGPLYYLCEYPIFIQDCDLGDGKYDYAENRTLRKYFVYRLSRQFPEGSQERLDVQECFRQKSFNLNRFSNNFMTSNFSSEDEPDIVRSFIKAHTDDGTWDSHIDRMPYGGTCTWEQDSELDSPDEDSDGSSSDGGSEGESRTGDDDAEDD